MNSLETGKVMSVVRGVTIKDFNDLLSIISIDYLSDMLLQQGILK